MRGNYTFQPVAEARYQQHILLWSMTASVNVLRTGKMSTITFRLSLLLIADCIDAWSRYVHFGVGGILSRYYG
ncbi:hypothetical protein BaRGS_00003379, partial [Batillaria attramentaria]